jgi:hypothetical protein
MKDWIQERYDDDLRSYDAFRAAINAAWEAVEKDFLLQLLETMPARCQAVIKANGLHTKSEGLVPPGLVTRHTTIPPTCCFDH